jgi:HEAT repeat protein
VRQAAAAALGHFRGDEEVAAALDRALDDVAYATAAAAARSLGRIRAAGSLEGLRRALGIQSHRELVRTGALEGLAALGDGAVLPEILAISHPPHFSRLRATALIQAAKLARDLPPEQRVPVREAAEEALFDPLYFVRRGGIQALKALGDDRGVGPLRALLARDVEGAVRGECRVAIEALQKGHGQEQELRTLRDEVERLSRAEVALRERLDRVEPARAAADGKGHRAKAGQRRR